MRKVRYFSMNPKGNTRAKYFGTNKPHKDKFKGRKGKIRKQELYKSRPKSVHVIDSEINELQSKYGKVGWYSYVACLISQWGFRLVELEKYLCILFTYLYIYRSNLSWMVLVWFWNTILFPQFIFNLWYELFVFQIQPKGIKTFSDFPLSKKTSDGMFTVFFREWRNEHIPNQMYMYNEVLQKCIENHWLNQ